MATKATTKKAPAKKAKAAEQLTYKVASPEAKLGEVSKDLKKMTTKSTKVAAIKTDKDYQAATDMVVEVKGRIKRIKELKTEYVKPLKDGVKNLEAMFNDPLKAYEDLERALKGGMSAYQIEQTRIRREAEAKAAKEAAEKAAAAAEAGEVIDPTPVQAPVERVAPTTRTEDGGKATSKMVWRHEVTNSEQALTVPETRSKVLTLAVEKGLLDQVLRAEVKMGLREHDGVRIYEDVDISVTA